MKKTQELKNEVRRKDEKNDQLSKELTQVNDQKKLKTEKQQANASKKLQGRIEELDMKVDEQAKENERLVQEVEKYRIVAETVKSTPLSAKEPAVDNPKETTAKENEKKEVEEEKKPE